MYLLCFVSRCIIPRVCNESAHFIACLGRSSTTPCIWIENIPHHIEQIALKINGGLSHPNLLAHYCSCFFNASLAISLLSQVFRNHSPAALYLDHVPTFRGVMSSLCIST
ncbi:hypothetical protein V6N13_020870 [Hibiscus sabdariffa]